MNLETYKPTLEDRDRVKPKPDRLKVSGDGVFATRQGEGITAGEPAVFLRLHFCNLKCGKESGWKCDTAYTWDWDSREFWTEPEDWSVERTLTEAESAWNNKFGTNKIATPRLVITGGEPLLQQRKFIPVIERLPGWSIEIETNGTIMPLPELSGRQLNCSPKMANSGNPQRLRFRPEVLEHINSLRNSWFKFVARSREDLEEIQELVSRCSLSTDKVLVMPEGYTKEIVEKHANLLREEVNDRGWQLVMRNQLVWYGVKRRT
jgi:7-carboxy-7-deazaguanine synthase